MSKRVKCVRFFAFVSTPHHSAQVDSKISLTNASTARRGKGIARASKTPGKSCTRNKTINASSYKHRDLPSYCHMQKKPTQKKQTKVYGRGARRVLPTTTENGGETGTAICTLERSPDRKKDVLSTGSPRKSFSKRRAWDICYNKLSPRFQN